MQTFSSYNSVIRSDIIYNSIVYLSKCLITFFLFSWLLIDTANGYLMRTIGFEVAGLSLGEILRIVFLLLLIFNLKINNSKGELIFILIPLLLLNLALLQYILLDSNLIASVNNAAKVSMPLLIFLYIKQNYQHAGLLIKKILYFNIFILILNIVVSLFGFGFYSYHFGEGIRVGGKGYFNAGNQVAGVILVLYSLLIFIYKDNIKKIIIITFIFLTAALITLTRSGIFGVILLFIISVFLFHKNKRIYILFSFIIALILTTVLFYDYLDIAIRRWTFAIDRSGFLVYMTGGDKRLDGIIMYYNEFVNNPLLFFIGSGWTGSAERDLFDLVWAFGIFGVLVYMIWLYFAVYIYKNNTNQSDKLFGVFVIFLLLTVATFAGHVVHAQMLAAFVPILANMHLLNNKGNFQKFRSYE